MNALRTSLKSFSKTFGPYQAKSQSTVAASAPLRPIPSIYHKNAESAGVHHALFNPKDPRTFPRYAVVLFAATFFSVTTANSFWYKHHHFRSADKNDSFAPTHNEVPTQMVRTVSKGPIAFNGKRYETLRHMGLGVNQDEWHAAKKARDSTPYSNNSN